MDFYNMGRVIKRYNYSAWGNAGMVLGNIFGVAMLAGGICLLTDKPVDESEKALAYFLVILGSITMLSSIYSKMNSAKCFLSLNEYGISGVVPGTTANSTDRIYLLYMYIVNVYRQGNKIVIEDINNRYVITPPPNAADEIINIIQNQRMQRG